ncbi:Uncharacterized protein TCM_008894 [Theobroma cacao]|uniref:Uncharacterized protein n=1 Tax=Theobroma cacao TaxID=3641 RepID=A0A061E4J4_THECC|nr:Uncharacterized protein TCM_008894 [Theobroma cacao]
MVCMMMYVYTNIHIYIYICYRKFMKIIVIVLCVGIVNCSQIAFHVNKNMAFDVIRLISIKMLCFSLQRDSFSLQQETLGFWGSHWPDSRCNEKLSASGVVLSLR